MRGRIQQIIFLSLFVVLAASANAVAQDAGMSDVEISEANREKASFTPGEDLRYVPRATGINAPSDSITLQIQDFPMQRAAQKPAEKSADKNAKKDDSILTFNFLYYIIQKYKLQDIID